MVPRLRDQRRLQRLEKWHQCRDESPFPISRRRKCVVRASTRALRSFKKVREASLTRSFSSLSLGASEASETSKRCLSLSTRSVSHDIKRKAGER
jgi:hypothetical protein